ncbi:MAG: hypothetical protein OES12_05030, partial [Anaerolineae bacterium]|nr:hypothetical protein [Anaerolineae bacterium]
FAMMSNTPFVSIIYQQKVDELLKETNLNNFGIEFYDLNTENLIDKIDYIWTNRHSLRRKLSNVASALFEEASEAPGLAMKLLDGNALK